MAKPAPQRSPSSRGCQGEADREHLLERGVGNTSLVSGATARADELDDEELVAGAAALEAKVALLQPAVTAILEVTAYRIASMLKSP